MPDIGGLTKGQILTGPLFSEPMRVETVAPNGPSAWTVGLVDRQPSMETLDWTRTAIGRVHAGLPFRIPR
jgi:hypothetical protein